MMRGIDSLMNSEKIFYGIVAVTIFAVLFFSAFMADIVPLPEKEFSPLRTLQEVKEHAEERVQTPCEGPGYRFSADAGFVLEPDEYGYVGSRAERPDGTIEAYTTFSECFVAISGHEEHVVFRVQVDPNNGWVYKQICNWHRVESCPQDENGEYVLIDRDFSTNPHYATYNALQ